MPLVIHPRTGKRLRRIAMLAAVACLGNTAIAAAACPTAPTTKAFSAFGDTADYSLAPGGSFEGTTTTWTGGSLVAGNEKYFINAATDTKSLSIAPGGVVTSPTFCIDASNPYFRLVAKKPTDGSLKIDVLYTDSSGKAQTATAGSLVESTSAGMTTYADWGPSPALRLGTALKLARLDVGTMADVKLRFTSNTGSTSNWQIDDVEIDPYRA
jgi:hypothetical protein